MDENPKDANKRKITRIAKHIVLRAPHQLNDDASAFAQMVETHFPGEITDYERLRAEAAVQHARATKFLFPDGSDN